CIAFAINQPRLRTLSRVVSVLCPRSAKRDLPGGCARVESGAQTRFAVSTRLNGYRLTRVESHHPSPPWLARKGRLSTPRRTSPPESLPSAQSYSSARRTPEFRCVRHPQSRVGACDNNF